LIVKTCFEDFSLSITYSMNGNPSRKLEQAREAYEKNDIELAKKAHSGNAHKYNEAAI
jgi:hypothetical protein